MDYIVQLVQSAKTKEELVELLEYSKNRKNPAQHKIIRAAILERAKKITRDNKRDREFGPNAFAPTNKSDESNTLKEFKGWTQRMPPDFQQWLSKGGTKRRQCRHTKFGKRHALDHEFLKYMNYFEVESNKFRNLICRLMNPSPINEELKENIIGGLTHFHAIVSKYSYFFRSNKNYMKIIEQHLKGIKYALRQLEPFHSETCNLVTAALKKSQALINVAR